MFDRGTFYLSKRDRKCLENRRDFLHQRIANIRVRGGPEPSFDLHEASVLTKVLEACRVKGEPETPPMELPRSYVSQGPTPVPKWDRSSDESDDEEEEDDYAKDKWGIWMKGEPGLLEGWWCGFGERQNEQFHRTLSVEDADSFDSRADAQAQAEDFQSYGYACEVRRIP